MSNAFVVVGGGMAGAKTAEALRDQGCTGSIALICEEELLPYERPPLSKDYLAGNTEAEEFTVRPRQWYDDNDVELHLGVRATAVHPGSHDVELSDGSRLGYDKLALATGSRPRRLPLPGSDARGVHYLRRRGDSERIRERLGTISRLVVVGGGWIGLEVAAVARGYGVEVTVVEAGEQPLVTAIGADLGAVFARLHREHGVDVRCKTHVTEIATSDGVRAVRLSDNTEVEADAVLIAVGARPETTLAEGAGLDVGEGVLVDANLTTSDPDIVAAGDIAEAMHPLLGTRVRVEHWATALHQPKVAAATMLGNRDAPYDRLPYFFTDQYDLGMEFHGHLPAGTEHRVVVRGDEDSREFVAFWLDSTDRVLAGMNVNVWGLGSRIKALIRADTPVSADRLADPDVDLAELTG